MANVHEKEIYGTILPEIFIEKITLENGGSTLIHSNPHVDNDRETIKNGQQPNTLKTTLDLVVKQKFEDDEISKWLQEVDFKKYYRIKIFEVEDARISTLFSLTKDVGLALDPRTYFAVKSPVKKLMRGYLKKEDNELISFIRQNVKIKELNLSYMSKQQRKRVVHETLDDGTKIINTYFSISFEHEKSEFGHLSYYCTSQLDYGGLMTDFGLRPTLNFMNYLVNLSKTNCEIVFDNFDIKKESYIYEDSEGKIWNGDVHRTNLGTIRTGLVPSETSIPVRRISVSNYVVQDFRTRARAETLNFDFNPIKKYFEKLDVFNSATNTNFLAKKNTYFSDILISSDRNRQAKIKFSLDYKSLIFDSTSYSYFIGRKDSKLADTIAQNTKIKSIKMYRQRVKMVSSSSNQLSATNGQIPFEKDKAPQLLFHSSRSENVIVDNSKFYLRRINSLDFPNVVEFTGVDKSLSKITDGLYSYSIEIELEDPFLQYVKNYSKVLGEAIAFMMPYYVDSQKMSIGNFIEEYSNPHLKQSKENDKKNKISEGNYNPIANTFTSSFKNKIYKRYDNLLEAPWILSTAIYAEAVSLFIPNTDKEDLLRQLIAMSSPNTGTPKGISIVISLMQQMQKNLLRIIGTKEGDLKHDYGSGRANRTPSFKVVHSFNNDRYDAKATSGVLFNYFEEKDNDTESNGIYTLTGEQFKQRIQEETRAFYSSDSPEVELSSGGLISQQNFEENKFKFITPIAVCTKKTIVSTLSLNESPSKSRLMNQLIGLAKAKKTRGETFFRTETEKLLGIKMFNNDFQAQFGLTYSIYTPEQIDIIKNRKCKPNNMSELSEEQQNILEKITNLIDNVDDIENAGIFSFISYAMNIMNLANEYKKLTLLPSSAAVEQVLASGENVPNQIASSLAPSDIQNTDTIPADDISTFSNRNNMVFGSIKQILVQTGFETGENGEVLLNSPKWEPLTQQFYDNVPNGIELVCKLSDYKQKNINADDLTRGIVKVADQYFILVSDNDDIDFEEESFEVKIPSPSQMIETSTITSQNIAKMLSQKVERPKIKIPKFLLNTAVKLELEQKKYPASLIKNSEVSKKTIEEIFRVDDISSEVRQRQEQMRQTNLAPPKVPSR